MSIFLPVPVLLALAACDGVTAPPGATARLAAIDQTNVFRPTLVVIRMDGSDARTLVVPDVEPGAIVALTGPRWLPSGNEIAYRIADAEHSTIRVTDLDGQSRPLFPEGTAPTVRQFDPVISQAGPWIHFIGDAGVHEPFAPFEVWRARPDGSGAEPIRELDRDADTALFDVSRDGRTLLLGRGSILYRMDVATGDTARLGPVVHGARFSPDGRRIAFSDMQELQVRVMGFDGTGIRTVSHPELFTWYKAGLSWTDDGAWLIARAVGGLHRIDTSRGSTVSLSWGGPYWEPDLRPR